MLQAAGYWPLRPGPDIPASEAAWLIADGNKNQLKAYTRVMRWKEKI